MQIQILNVTPSNPTGKNGKSYSKLEVAFKNLSFQGKVEGKQLMGFGDTKPAHDVLILAQPGEVFEIEVKKNDKGYNDWLNANKSGSAGARPASGAAPTSAASTGYTPTTSPKSTYETPEERAKKQVYIVRQSSISNAISILSVGSKSRPDVAEVIDVASRLEDYVFGRDEAKAADYAASAKPSDFDDEIPF